MHDADEALWSEVRRHMLAMLRAFEVYHGLEADSLRRLPPRLPAKATEREPALPY